MVDHVCYEKFEKHYEDNPFESVFDLEEEDIQINRFVLVQSDQIFYLEVDRSMNLSEKKVSEILRGLKDYDGFLKHFARRIEVHHYHSTTATITEITRGGLDYSLFSFWDSNLTSRDQNNDFAVDHTNRCI